LKEIGFDIISDLYLSPDDSFNWEGKATSLYCIVAGNISSDTRTLLLTLSHLSKFYQGVFFVTGQYDLEKKDNIEDYNKKLSDSFSAVPRISSLYENVIVIDGIAIIGVNGWRGKIIRNDEDYYDSSKIDITYLYQSIQKLQRHLDVKRILVVSSSVPGKDLYFGEQPTEIETQIPLQSALAGDSESKVTHWIFGTYEKNVDTIIEGVHYVNNPYLKRRPYWPKRINITV